MVTNSKENKANELLGCVNTKCNVKVFKMFRKHLLIFFCNIVFKIKQRINYMSSLSILSLHHGFSKSITKGYWQLVFKHPANIFISGPSGSGKTKFCKKMIEYREDLIDILPQYICVTKNGDRPTISYKNAKGLRSNLFLVFSMTRMISSLIPVHRTW